jgi:serine/threonine protein phosphatase PrpC
LALSRIAVLPSIASSVTEDSIAAMLQTVHSELCEIDRSSPQYRGMGTTVAGIVILPDQAFLFNVGDSRIYRREGNFLQILSVDDRPASGAGFGEDADQVQTNVLLQCLGGSPSAGVLTPHITGVPLGKEETFLLCTDGLYDAVPLDEIESSVNSATHDSLPDLLRKTIAAGAPDNVTIISLRVSRSDAAASET